MKHLLYAALPGTEDKVVNIREKVCIFLELF